MRPIHKSAPLRPFTLVEKYHADGTPVETTTYPGMNLEDHVAIEFMKVLIADHKERLFSGPEKLAGFAYRYTDAFFAERERRHAANSSK